MQPNHRGWRVIAVGSVFAGLATVSLILRLVTRFHISRKGGIDDYIIVVAWMFAIFTLTSTILQVVYGLGHQQIHVPPDQAINLFRVNYAFRVLYITGTTAVRTSILFQLLRILADRTSRAIAWGLMAFSLTYGITFILTLSFGCRPIAFYWDKSIANGHCITMPVVWVVYASINMVEDLAIFILPFPTLWILTLPLKRKLLVNFMMALGGGVVIITFVCFNHLAQNLQAMSSGDWDFSYNFADHCIRAQLELYLGITCACLPYTKPLFKSLFPERATDEARTAHPPTFGTPKSPRERPPTSIFISLNPTESPRGSTDDSSSSDSEESLEGSEQWMSRESMIIESIT